MTSSRIKMVKTNNEHRFKNTSKEWFHYIFDEVINLYKIQEHGETSNKKDVYRCFTTKIMYSFKNFTRINK